MPKIAGMTVLRIKGMEALAAELGVGRQHIWRVATGQRASRRVSDALARHGIRCKPVRHASTH